MKSEFKIEKHGRVGMCRILRIGRIRYGNEIHAWAERWYDKYGKHSGDTIKGCVFKWN